MSKILNLALADDHSVVANGLKMLLSASPNLNILPACKNGLEVLELLAQGTQVDLLITDVNMPEMDGLTLAREVKKISPDTRIVFLSMIEDLNFMAKAFGEGASAYLVKNTDVDELLLAVNRAIDHKIYFSNDLAVKLIDDYLQRSRIPKVSLTIELTQREQEVLSCIAEGMTNFEISEKLFLSKRTVEGHRQSLLDKTNARNTATLIRYAVRNGLID